MKSLIWIAFALLAMMWTGLALVSTELTGWLAASVDTAQVANAASAVGEWPVPAWLALWIDPAWAVALQAAWVQAVAWLGASGPALGSVVGWLIPLIWIVWGGVLLLMLVAAAAAHFLVVRLARAPGLQHTPA